jgi:hypothetical protein
MMPMASPAREQMDPQRRQAVPMPARSAPSQASGRMNWQMIVRVLLWGALAAVVVGETLLLLVALIPLSVWAAHHYPNGPIPQTLAPVVAGLFYVLPSVTGMLCRRWQAAVVLATLPAWLDLGAFAVAASVGGHIGPFYLAQDPHSIGTVGTLELFAALGMLGWLARSAALGLFGRGEWARR